jgi:hypothetical protein
MDFAVRKFVAVRSGSVLVLAVLLLLTPMCGAICQAQMCAPTPAGGEKSACHESFAAAADASNSHISSMQNCTLQQLSVALPASFRSLSGDSPLFANAERNASPVASFGVELLPGTDTHLLFSSSGQARTLSHFSEESSLVLRI